jgi:anti-anti-sigma factor
VIELISEKIGNTATVRISGRIDADTSKALEDACAEWIAQGEKILILDFSRVRYISSWGLRCVLTIGKNLSAQGGSLITCGLSAMVKEVFQISGFDSLFRTFPTLEGALASL